MRAIHILTFFFLVLVSSCIEITNQFDALPPGIWRATLELDNSLPTAAMQEEVSVGNELGDVLPFLFELKYRDDNTFYIEIINGKERIPIEDIRYGRDKATAKDTVWIDFPVYDSYIKAIYEENIMEGQWHVKNRGNYQIPFKAYYGQEHLFTTDLEPPVDDISGKWSCTFEIGLDTEYPAIAEFDQEGNILYGTFLTEIGDYRYLSGEITNDKFNLSTFDGSHAFFFEGKILEDKSIIGTFRAGKHHTATWSAIRDSEVILPDPFKNTVMVNQDIPFELSLPNTNGDLITLDDDQFAGKAKIIQIMGTWCPNCKDETMFLKNFLKSDDSINIEVIAIAFEKYRNDQKAVEILKRFKEKWQIPYNVLLGGYYDKAEASSTFPMLNQIISYPTLIFLDKDNLVKGIYTGFTGPATSEYENFQKGFYNIVSQLNSDRQ